MLYRVSIDPAGVNHASSDFSAPSLASAQALAQTLATALNRPLYLAGGPGNTTVAPAFTLYTPITAQQGATITSLGGSYGSTVPYPSGIGTT